MAEPYWSDGSVTLYLGDCREILPALGITAHCLIADPPYESTSLEWDRWPEGWPEAAASAANSMWCFLPLRQFAEPPYRGIEFRTAGWKLSQDVIWEKANGTSRANDRFRNVHEQLSHWYRGRWSGIHHQAVRVPYDRPPSRHGHFGTTATPHLGQYGDGSWTETGTRLMKSVIKVPGMWRRRAVHRTQKAEGILLPLIEYSCPPGGLVIDLFAGSGSTLQAARASGRRAIGIELREPAAEQAARHLSQTELEVADA